MGFRIWNLGLGVYGQWFGFSPGGAVADAVAAAGRATNRPASSETQKEVGFSVWGF